ncbi:MAG: beta-glucanase (GH16 family) [Myxococcota bacterium]|jgi:beta-glucanase (GH16 family)
MRALLCALVALSTACGESPESETWTLVWADEFDGPAGTAPDSERWTYDIGGDGWGNQQLEYNSDRTENVDLDGNGFLRITAQKEDFQGNGYTSGRIKTQGLFSTTYGRIEARVNLPAGQGIWPAFWMLGNDIDEVSWPACGEIDILELRGQQPNRVLGTVHGPGYAGGNSIGGEIVLDEPVTDDFHVYAIEWDPDHITWYFDDQVINTVNPGDTPGTWVFDHDFFLILNVAVGGTFLGDPDSTTVFPAVMGVDYVRVYERTEPFAVTE